MVGDRQVRVAARLRGERHLLHRVLAVLRPRRVGVEVAAQIALLDERGQLAVARRLQLARGLAQLGRDELVAEPLVQLPSEVNVCTSPDSTSLIPYSEIDSPRRWASSRIATLWFFEPVKCWSRFP